MQITLIKKSELHSDAADHENNSPHEEPPIRTKPYIIHNFKNYVGIEIDSDQIPSTIYIQIIMKNQTVVLSNKHMDRHYSTFVSKAWLT